MGPLCVTYVTYMGNWMENNIKWTWNHNVWASTEMLYRAIIFAWTWQDMQNFQSRKQTSAKNPSTSPWYIYIGLGCDFRRYHWPSFTLTRTSADHAPVMPGNMHWQAVYISTSDWTSAYSSADSAHAGWVAAVWLTATGIQTTVHLIPTWSFQFVIYPC